MSSSVPGEILGLHHVKVAVTDLRRSRSWYERVFELEPIMEWPDAEGVVRGVRFRAKGAFALALREDPKVAQATVGYDPFAILVQGRGDVEAWADRLDELGVAHSPVTAGALGWLVWFDDPDGLQLKIYSEDAHGLSREELASVARPVDGAGADAPR
jgi:catechol 2,3-dioxygenase-like lactoylglutathione lyase family enzyme